MMYFKGTIPIDPRCNPLALVAYVRLHNLACAVHDAALASIMRDHEAMQVLREGCVKRQQPDEGDTPCLSCWPLRNSSDFSGAWQYEENDNFYHSDDPAEAILKSRGASV